MAQDKAIVVGAGFGGAVVAARLAERGLGVLVLERGPWWGAGGTGRPAAVRRDFPRGLPGIRRLVRNVRWTRGRRGRDVLVHADGLFEWHAFAAAHAVVASGVGGGSLVYTNILQEPPDGLFDAFPPELSADELAPCYDRVRAMLRPAPAPHALAKTAALERAAGRVGMGPPRRPDLAIAWGGRPDAGEPVDGPGGAPRWTCVHAGNCVVGCEFGAKTTLDLTYVPHALRHGARVRALCEVVAIGRDGRDYTVVWIDHATGRRWRARAPRLVLAAGTLGTVRLLLEARDRLRTLPALPPALGSRFTTNGDMLAVLRQVSPSPESDRGPTITATVEDNADGEHFVLGEAGMPLRALGLPAGLHRRLATWALLLGMGQERAGARLRLGPGGLRSDAGRHVDPQLYTRMERAAAELATGYRPRRAHVAWPRGRGRGPLVTVHPLGGCSIGRTPFDGVTDHTGEVFGHRGLYVADGSLYPRAPGVPPSLTIAALAERQAALMR